MVNEKEKKSLFQVTVAPALLFFSHICWKKRKRRGAICVFNILIMWIVECSLHMAKWTRAGRIRFGVYGAAAEREEKKCDRFWTRTHVFVHWWCAPTYSLFAYIAFLLLLLLYSLTRSIFAVFSSLLLGFSKLFASNKHNIVYMFQCTNLVKLVCAHANYTPNHIPWNTTHNICIAIRETKTIINNSNNNP